MSYERVERGRGRVVREGAIGCVMGEWREGEGEGG